MKLLIFLGSLIGGGAERVAVTLSSGFARRGMEVTVVTLDSKEDFYKVEAPVRHIVLDGKSDSKNLLQTIWITLRRIIALRKVIRRISPDWIMALMTQTNVLALLANLGLRTKIAVWEQNHPPFTASGPRGRLWEWLRRFTYPKANVVAALTKKSEDWLVEHYPKVKTVVIPNPVSWPLSDFSPVLKPAKFIDVSKHLLLASGHFSTKKGFDMLLEAFSRIYKKHPAWQLAILGDGQEEEALKNFVSERGLGKAVIMPGRAGNIGDWYRRADLFVLSSRHEGFPLVVVEAMAYGVPVVSFDCDTGPRDIIREGIDGFLVPAGDIAALAEALSKVMGDDGLRKRLAERAPEVRERFPLERILDMWEHVFSS